MSRARFLILLSALLVACPSEDDPIPVDDDDDDAAPDDDDAVLDDDDSAPSVCDPALTFDVASLDAVYDAPEFVDLITLIQYATGGTGDYRFELTADGSGAVVNELTGAYLPGEVVGAIDTVTLSDTGCEGSTTVDITVVSGLRMAPDTVEALPGTSFQFAVTGGSGQWTCAEDSMGSGTIDEDCNYVAGGDEGTDTIIVTDDSTGQVRGATVHVLADARLKPDPAFIGIPLGGTYELRIDGGSGYITLTPDIPDLVSYTEGILEADAPGRVRFDVDDDFTGETTSITVEVLEPLQADFDRGGENGIYGRVASPGDIDGDGFPDAIFSRHEADVTQYNSGAVWIYRGTADGLDPTPVREFAGEVWEEEMGWDIATGDFNGDDLIDLAIGSRRRHEGASDNGAVLIYHGIQGGFFEATATQILVGERGSDYFGRSVGTCDFNDDGFLDLAVGASSDEDNTAQTVAGGQGGVHIFLGSATGFLPDANQIVWGVEPDGAGGWMSDPSQQLGLNLEVGDVTGDGLCDLVAASWEYDQTGRSNNQGIVLLHAGVAADGVTNGGVTPLPVAAFTPTQLHQSGPQLGRSVAVGDVNNDGQDDLVLGAWYFKDINQNSVRHGGIAVFESYDWAANPRTTFVDIETESDQLYVGDNSYDYFGHGLTVADMDGNGTNDLLVGAPQDEVAGGTSTTGAVQILLSAGPGEYPVETAISKLPGFSDADFFGGRVVDFPDIDGDGQREILTLAFRDDLYGPRVGAVYLIKTTALDPAQWVPLDYPGLSAGQMYGRTSEVVSDLDGDGWDDLLVGAPRTDHSDSNTYNNGVTEIRWGSASGFAAAPDLTLRGYTGHSNDDQAGWDVSTAGDFNNDGHTDIAVLARYDDRPSNQNPYEGACGSSYRSNTGSVNVFLGNGTREFDTAPDFVWWGPDTSDGIERIDGGFDFNGDGYDDIVVAGPSWDRSGQNNTGGFAILEGRPKTGTQPNAICTAYYTFRGDETGGSVGKGLAAIGDLDGDGCDEIAAGSYLEDQGIGNQGIVRVFYGFGGAGCPTIAQATAYGSYDNNAYMGWSMDAGHDVDGDTVPDLVVGGFNLGVSGNNGVGAAWLVPGAWFNMNAPEAVFDNVAPTTIHPIVNLPGRWRLEGEVPVEYFGRSVALVPNLDGGRAGIAIGSPHGARAGVPDSGGVRVHRFNTDPSDYGLEVTPYATLGGEDWAPDSWLGMWLAPQPEGGRPIVAVGGDRADGAGIDTGAVYVVDLTP